MATTYEYKYDIKTIYDTFKNNRLNVVSYLGTSNNGNLDTSSSAYLSYINNSTDTYIYARKSSPTINSNTHKNYAYLKVGNTTYNFYRGHAYTYTETVTGNGTKPILIANDFVNQISTDLKFNKVSINHNATAINDIAQTVNVFSPISYIIENGSKSIDPKNKYSISKNDITTLLNGSTFADFTTYVTYSYLDPTKYNGIIYEDGKDTLSADPINDIHVWSLADGIENDRNNLCVYISNDNSKANTYAYLELGNTLKNFFNDEISDNHNIFDNVINGTDEYKYIKFNYEPTNSIIEPEVEDEIVTSFGLNVNIRTHVLFENFLKNNYETSTVVNDTSSMGSIPYELYNSNLSDSNQITFEYDNEYNDTTLFSINILAYNSVTNNIYSNETIYETLSSLGQKMYTNTGTGGTLYYKGGAGCGFVSSSNVISKTTGNCDKNGSIVNSFISSNVNFSSINNYKSICLCYTSTTTPISNNTVLEGLLIKNKQLLNRTLKNDKLKVIFDFNKNANNEITTSMKGYHNVNNPYNNNANGHVLTQSGNYTKKTTYKLSEAYLAVYHEGSWKVYNASTPYFNSPNSDYNYGFDIIRNGGVTELRYILVYSPKSSTIIPS